MTIQILLQHLWMYLWMQTLPLGGIPIGSGTWAGTVGGSCGFAGTGAGAATCGSTGISAWTATPTTGSNIACAVGNFTSSGAITLTDGTNTYNANGAQYTGLSNSGVAFYQQFTAFSIPSPPPSGIQVVTTTNFFANIGCIWWTGTSGATNGSVVGASISSGSALSASVTAGAPGIVFGIASAGSGTTTAPGFSIQCTSGVCPTNNIILWKTVTAGAQSCAAVMGAAPADMLCAPLK